MFKGTIAQVDSSGTCKISYSDVSTTGLIKTKADCSSEDLDNFKEKDEILGIKRIFSSLTQYKFDDSIITNIKSREFNLVYFSAKEEIGSKIDVEHSLLFLNKENIETVEAQTIEDAITKIEAIEKIEFIKDTLLTKFENTFVEKHGEFGKTVKNLKEFLKTSNLGKLKPIKAFLKLVNVAKSSTKEEISKALSQKKNKDIL